MRSLRAVLTGVAAAACVLGGAPRSGAAQSPSTDIWVAELRLNRSCLVADADRRAACPIEVGTPRNITNRDGYDNQPSFSRDGRAVLYNSEQDGQTEIMREDVASGARRRLTFTPGHNEYSPSETASGELLVVRWPTDMSTGALWRYTADGVPLAQHAGSVERIGYYGVIDDARVAVFVNDSARTFIVADTRTGERRRILTGMGGSPPQHIPGTDAVSFMMEGEDGREWIHRLELATGAVSPIAPRLGEATSYAWLPGNVLLMPGGNALHAFDPAVDREWRQVASYDDAGLQSIVRIAVSPAGDRVALVAARPAR